MKANRIRTVAILLILVLAHATHASTDIFGSGGNEFTVDFVEVGNAGNEADTSGYGSVGYAYRIAKFEITNDQWEKFVAAAGIPVGTPSSGYDKPTQHSGANIPVTGLSWLEAAQFCNWLTSGSKTNGAYVFTGSGTSTEFLSVDRISAVGTHGTVYVLPSKDEWYKAAYHTGSGYSDYANGTDTIPALETEANYGGTGGTYSHPWDVGTGTLTEQNGTKDMMGNVYEWTESTIDGVMDYPEENRALLGGSYYDPGGEMSKVSTMALNPDLEGFATGFRIASIDTIIYPDVTLTVASSTGSPVPAIGMHTNTYGASVACSVANVETGLTQYACTGWSGNGSVPTTGTSNAVEVVLTEDSSIVWNWQTNYWLDVNVTGNGSVDVADGFYPKDSEQNLTATPDAGWLFMGWSGDASGTNSAAVTMDAPKAVTATFSDDADGDGLLNSNETAIGSNPWKSDTDDDGFDDAFEVQQGLSPTNDNTAVVDYIQNHGSTFGLYPSNVVLDVALGQILLDITGGTASLNLQLEASGDLVIWTNAGPPEVWNWPVDVEKQFFRVRAGQ